MKRSLYFGCMVIACTLLMACVPCSIRTKAAEASASEDTNETTILEGVYIGEVKVGGLTKEEAENKIAEYLKSLNEKHFMLMIEDAAGHGEKRIVLSQLEAGWANPEVIDEVISLARRGNVIKRYKERKDIENNHGEYRIRLRIDRNRLLEVLKDNLAEYEISAVNAGISLPERNADFVITEGHDGRKILYDEMVFTLADYIENEWNYTDGVIFQVMTEVVPIVYNADSMRLIGREAMGSFSTTFKSSTPILQMLLLRLMEW